MRGWAALAVVAAGCFPDDWDGQPYVPTPSTPVGDDDDDDTGAEPVDDGIVGDWVSEGSDRSPMFSEAPFDYALVEASFEPGGGFVVSTTDREGTEYVLTGTYAADDGTPGGITLSQVQPYLATAEGLWQVDGDALTYEVVQTVPDYGFEPPTVGSGFGSTAGPGLDSGDNVQTYRRR